MEEQKEGGMPSYVIVITSVLIAVILIVLVGAIILLAIGAANNPANYDVPPTEDTTITIDVTEEIPVVEVTIEAEETPVIEMTPEADITSEVELTPEGTPSS